VRSGLQLYVPLETLVVSPRGAVLNRLSAFSRLEQRLVGECSLGWSCPRALFLGSAAACDRTCQRRWLLRPFRDGRDRGESALTGSFEPGEQAFELFVMLQQHGHDEDLEGPWPRQIHPSLDVELGAVEETIKGGLIVLTQRASKWCPSPAFVLDELAEGRKRSTHKISPPTVRTLHDGRRG
jgi:hypothetical protein